MVTPSDDGLQQIRSGIDQQTKRPWWKHPATPALAAALVLGVMAGGIAVFAGGDDNDDNVVATQPSTSTTASESAQTEPSDPPATGTPTTPIAVEGDVYVYYAMDDGKSPRLYREQRPQPGHGPGHGGGDHDGHRAAAGHRLLLPVAEGHQAPRRVGLRGHGDRRPAASSRPLAPRPRRPPCRSSSTPSPPTTRR